MASLITKFEDFFTRYKNMKEDSKSKTEVISSG